MAPRELRPWLQTEAISTEELLRLHEHAFGALDPIGKRRILELVRANGWDRRRSIDSLAA